MKPTQIRASILFAILISAVITEKTDDIDMQNEINPTKVDSSSSLETQTIVTIRFGDGEEQTTNITATATPTPTPAVKPKESHSKAQATIITCLMDWMPGRVEEQRLRVSAILNNYTIKVVHGTNATLEKINDRHIVMFLPRPEGLIQGSPQLLSTALQDRKADILLVVKEITVLVGYASSIRRAMLIGKMTTLPELTLTLSTNAVLRNKVRAKFDSLNALAFAFNQFSSIGNGGLEMVSVEEKDRYEVRFSGQAPVLLLADPNSSHARALLLATSDYLTGEQRPVSGCQNCQQMTDLKLSKPKELLMIAFLILAPHPFLLATVQGIMGLNDKTTRIYIYNQVPEYKEIVSDTIYRLKNVENFTNVEVIQSSATLHLGGLKNMMLNECKRIGCTKFIHIDSKVFMNPGRIETIAKFDLPVFAPVLNMQMSITSNFNREINSQNGLPGFSWDHLHIVRHESENRLEGFWHAACVHDFYSLRRDIIDQVSSAYTSQGSNNSDASFCHTLREAGIPMLVSNTVKEAGMLVNATGHNINDSDILAFESNPVIWNGFFSDPEFQALMAGDTSVVKSPCDEVYEVPFLSELGAREIETMAAKSNKWSSAVKKDPRKDNKLEDVPTVDIFLKDLGLENLMRHLRKETNLQYAEREIAFPKMGAHYDIVLSLVARFKSDEQPGLPLHHDASVTTWFINLTPRQMYKGGEVLFPNQGDCITNADVGRILIFPGELTHPKILKNVTEGVLYKMILHTGDY
ncbi:unnamed protein product [Meganyctiphanes norvegica]|uniref:Prolyl 4-hydroxylase alpha subunit domain-containing protein n=1 Tax=Meganyctiphanes norvegica TaxID=48144 RepID=A0AAV2PXQ4_MEGNR